MASVVTQAANKFLQIGQAKWQEDRQNARNKAFQELGWAKGL